MLHIITPIRKPDKNTNKNSLIKLSLPSVCIQTTPKLNC